MWIVLAIVAAVLVGAAAFSIRYAWWMPAVDERYPRILMYHMIAESRPGWPQRGLRVSPARFEAQLAWLKREGWTFMTMSELMEAAGTHPPKTVVLTFDDGYEDNYSVAFPLLKRFGAKATLYLVVDRHNRDWSVYKKAHHNDGVLARTPKLTDEQVREMVGSGVWELGGHTMGHVNLARADEATRDREIAGCRAVLKAAFDCEAGSFAYPFGIYSDADVAAVRRAGFTSAVTTRPGINPDPRTAPFELKRVKISGKDGMPTFRLRMRLGKRGLWK